MDAEFYSPDPGVGRATIATWWSRHWSRTSGSIRRSRPAPQSGRRLTVIGEGPERARLEAMAGPTVRFLGWQPDDVIRDHYRRCRALLFPGEEDFGIVPDRGPGLRCAGDRAGARRRGRDRRRFASAESTPSRPRPPCSPRSTPGNAQGCPHDPSWPAAAPSRCPAAVFRQTAARLPGRVVATGGSQHVVPPAPHLNLRRPNRDPPENS